MKSFKLSPDFAFDPKVTFMPESYQVRLIKVFCYHAKGVLATWREAEIAHAMGISLEELGETKAVFVDRGFITDKWEVRNWDKHQGDKPATIRKREERARKRDMSRDMSATSHATSHTKKPKCDMSRDKSVTWCDPVTHMSRDKSVTPPNPPRIKETFSKSLVQDSSDVQDDETRGQHYRTHGLGGPPDVWENGKPVDAPKNACSPEEIDRLVSLAVERFSPLGQDSWVRHIRTFAISYPAWWVEESIPIILARLSEKPKTGAGWAAGIFSNWQREGKPIEKPPEPEPVAYRPNGLAQSVKPLTEYQDTMASHEGGIGALNRRLAELAAIEAEKGAKP